MTGVLATTFGPMPPDRIAVRRVPDSGGRGERPDLWGDGFADDGPDVAWSCRCWTEVDDDELVFLLPGLPVPDGGRAPHRLTALVRRVLAARAYQAALELTGSPDLPDSRDGRAILRHLHAVGTLSSMRPDAVWREGRSSTVARSSHPGRRTAWFLPTGRRTEAVSERRGLALAILQGMDRLHADVLRPVGARHPITVAEGVFASVCSGINAAYVYPALACMHGTLAAGAWLGHVFGGRSALMPLAVAEVLVDLLDPHEAPSHPADDLLRAHLDRAGLSLLLSTARRVVAGGGSRRVGAGSLATASRGRSTRILAALASAGQA